MKNSLLSRPDVIRQYLMNLVYSNREDHAMIPSERELCRKFGVTRPTVRLAVKALVQEGVVEIRPGFGTFITKRIYHTDEFDHPYRTVAILIGHGRNVVLDRFFWEINASAGMELVCRNVKIRPANLLSAERLEGLNELRNLRADGVIWICPHDIQYVRELEKMGIPVICVNRGMDTDDLHYVSMEMEKAGYRCGTYFLKKNCRNILYVRRPESFSDRLYFNGMKAAFADEKIPFSTHLVVDEIPGWEEKLGLLLDSRTPIDGFYMDSQLVSEVLSLLRRKNRVLGAPPYFISSRHRMELSPDVPCLMLDMPLAELGRRAAQRLLERLDGKSTGRICDSIPIPMEDRTIAGRV